MDRLSQTKTKKINGQFYTYRRIHFTRENASFCDNCVLLSVYPFVLCTSKAAEL